MTFFWIVMHGNRISHEDIFHFLKKKIQTMVANHIMHCHLFSTVLHFIRSTNKDEALFPLGADYVVIISC